MKILVVTTVDFQLNGITSVIMNYYRNMDKTGIQMDFLAPNEVESGYREEIEKHGSKTYVINRKENPFLYLINVYRLLKKNKYDVVHIHGNSAMMLIDILPAVLAGTKNRIVHSHNTTCSHMKLHKLFNPFFKHMYHQGVACGEAAGQWLFEDRPFLVLKNGIDLTRFMYNEERRETYRQIIEAGEKKVICHIGNFVEQKNHNFLIDCFQELLKKDENYILLLIGDGYLMDSMKKKAENLSICQNVIFLGKTLNVSDYLQAADVFVLPSFHEGLPVALVEAQAAGLPCIVSDKVSKEADLSESFRFLSINSVSVWADKMEAAAKEAARKDRQEICAVYQRKIKEKGYDIVENANILKKLYLGRD